MKTLCFHKSGRPRGWLRKLLKNSDGGIKKVFHRIVYKKNGNVRQEFSTWLNGDAQLSNVLYRTKKLTQNESIAIDKYLQVRHPQLSRLRVFPEVNNEIRINLVTDSIGPESFFGGVATACIMASLWAEQENANLRVITRCSKSNQNVLGKILSLYNISFNQDIEYHFSSLDGNAPLPIRENDYFIATSWWTAHSLLRTVSSSKIVYILQEDERMFYPQGDEWVNCEETISEKFALTVVNTKLLHDHLIGGPNEIPSLADHSVYFEPSFLPAKNVEIKNNENGVLKVFFYARPHNARNLFEFGLKCISNSIKNGTIRKEAVEFHFVGRDVPDLTLPSGVSLVIHEPMEYTKYFDFIEEMDAAFVLMATPHPSYPPLDFASKGKPVLTNAYMNKQDLGNYSRNIITKKLNVEEMSKAFSDLLSLAEDKNERMDNLTCDTILRDWNVSFAEVMGKLKTVVLK